jgi:hypothetical protein
MQDLLYLVVTSPSGCLILAVRLAPGKSAMLPFDVLGLSSGWAYWCICSSPLLRPESNGANHAPSIAPWGDLSEACIA